MIFQSVQPIISGNKHLFRPQIEAYEAAFSYFREFTEDKNREILLILPTGTGKTGLMSLLPFQLSKGRVLVIAPGKIIRKTIFKEFDSIQTPEQTFWYKRKVILDRKSLPKTYLYTGYDPNKQGEKDLTLKKLNKADIIITNIHKIVGSTEEVNLIDLVDRDFFDMIILDEAHHCAAPMWKETLEYFTASKVIKLTGTPYRSDGLDISTNPYDPVYEFTLGEAIQEGLVKETIKQEEIPNKLEFVNKDTGKQYTLNEAREKLGNNWVNRNVAMDERCSKEVIRKTARILKEKRRSYPFHQVLGVACNDQHARDLTKWFEEEGLTAIYVSSHLSSSEIERRINDFNNGVYDAVINIQMLGEGFDNPNISIISIFRPFKTLTPYAQVIGRGLRKIRAKNLKEIDNFCNVVYHRELDLEKLWKQFKVDKDYAAIKRDQLRMIREEFFHEQLSLDFGEVGMVENRPDLTKPDKLENDEPERFESTGYVKSYRSAGLGNTDSFLEDGNERYRRSLERLSAKTTLEHEKEVNRYYKLYKKGSITEQDYNFLVQNIENKFQTSYNKDFLEFKELIEAGTMREDFSKWLNTQIEYFFRKSTLDKHGYELFNDSQSSDLPVDNIGYIAKNIRKSLYQHTKKSVGTYNSKDFALAKRLVHEKLEFYLQQYGWNEEA